MASRSLHKSRRSKVRSTVGTTPRPSPAASLLPAKAHPPPRDSLRLAELACHILLWVPEHGLRAWRGAPMSTIPQSQEASSSGTKPRRRHTLVSVCFLPPRTRQCPPTSDRAILVLFSAAVAIGKRGLPRMPRAAVPATLTSSRAYRCVATCTADRRSQARPTGRSLDF